MRETDNDERFPIEGGEKRYREDDVYGVGKGGPTSLSFATKRRHQKGPNGLDSGVSDGSARGR